jgi:hypothetical protein
VSIKIDLLSIAIMQFTVTYLKCTIKFSNLGEYFHATWIKFSDIVIAWKTFATAINIIKEVHAIT